MPDRDPVFTPELIKVMKIFLFSAFGLVLLLSFFNEYRANNSGEDPTFRLRDSDRMYFLNVRSIHYDREIRKDAGMTLFRHDGRLVSDSLPILTPILLIYPSKDRAYVYFELENAEWPIKVKASLGDQEQVFDFENGGHEDHFRFLEKIKPFANQETQFELLIGEKSVPLWSGDKEKEALITTIEDYYRLIAYPTP